MADAHPQIVLASQNPGKVAEMRGLLDGRPWRVVGLVELGINQAPEETGTTFSENALLKARYYAGCTGELVVADDSGLSVDALGGAPGLYTSRFGGSGLDDSERNQLLLRKLERIPEAERGARFTSAVALVRDREVLFEALETCEGRIAIGPSGDQGFGYDPVFFYPPFGTTMGCLPPEQKATVSHRGKAFARLARFLETLS